MQRAGAVTLKIGAQGRFPGWTGEEFAREGHLYQSDLNVWNAWLAFVLALVSMQIRWTSIMF